VNRVAQSRPGFRPRLVLLAIAAGAILGIGSGLVVHSLAGEQAEGGLGLPSLHGQVSWSAGERPAPPFALRDQTGAFVSLGGLRSRPVLLTFFDSHCVEQCPIMGRQLADLLRRMPSADRPTLVLVSVNPAGDTPASIRRAMREWRLAGPWRWHWLRGTKRELASVWRDYGITVEPTTNDITHGLALYLIDRKGFERPGYLFPFLPNFVTLDLQRLAGEQV
jgi:cytochrome oxidase Cu insertion factor (SCO1/SenC/PrrC family)